jgi:hypothetical protein
MTTLPGVVLSSYLEPKRRERVEQKKKVLSHPFALTHRRHARTLECVCGCVCAGDPYCGAWATRVVLSTFWW